MGASLVFFPRLAVGGRFSCKSLLVWVRAARASALTFFFRALRFFPLSPSSYLLGIWCPVNSLAQRLACFFMKYARVLLSFTLFRHLSCLSSSLATAPGPVCAGLCYEVLSVDTATLRSDHGKSRPTLTLRSSSNPTVCLFFFLVVWSASTKRARARIRQRMWPAV